MHKKLLMKITKIDSNVTNNNTENILNTETKTNAEDNKLNLKQKGKRRISKKEKLVGNNTNVKRCLRLRNRIVETVISGSISSDLNVEDTNKNTAQEVSPSENKTEQRKNDETSQEICPSENKTEQRKNDETSQVFCPSENKTEQSKNDETSQEICPSENKTEQSKNDETSQEICPSENKTEQRTNDETSVNSGDVTMVFMGLDKINYDIKIDPNVVDKYTNKPVILLPGARMPSPESPVTKRRRIDKENMVIAKQCRLYPANEMYNQGPVINPPLISPGKIVGYTPAGQRHEVDLNSERPTWFNSEYARMQFDDATRVNALRMFNEMANGSFLPDGLDPNLERKYIAERELVTRDAREHFEKCVNNNKIGGFGTSDNVENDKHLSFLEVEKQLVDLIYFIGIKSQDFPEELAKKLKTVLSLKLTPLMIKKQCVIVEMLEKLVLTCRNYDIVISARKLLDKIKGLFDVPESQDFKEFFSSEIKRLSEKAKSMNVFDMFMMTEEPTEVMSNKLLKTNDKNTCPTAVLDSNKNHDLRHHDPWIANQSIDCWRDIVPVNRMRSNMFWQDTVGDYTNCYRQEDIDVFRGIEKVNPPDMFTDSVIDCDDDCQVISVADSVVKNKDDCQVISGADSIVESDDDFEDISEADISESEVDCQDTIDINSNGDSSSVILLSDDDEDGCKE